MWQLTADHCKYIPVKKAENVVFTITDYRKDEQNDKQMVDILERNYKKIYAWVQGSNDLEYILSLSNKIEIVDPTLEAYDKLLDSDLDLDYVGTRLHAGIRALQKKRRSIIIGIDNRALEKQRDFNINVINRNEINSLDTYLNKEISTEIKLDVKAIEDWKAQFVK
ncbi:hypothetical protein JNUCC1_00974 [Lentibacillus sp. JNUCC-1]|nr:hypothetical protein [Lentibacillus sp. JNUCC-1]MUV37168.1 hypothetical protein [Lentibacillus sp. JNUCC-1]